MGGLLRDAVPAQAGIDFLRGQRRRDGASDARSRAWQHDGGNRPKPLSDRNNWFWSTLEIGAHEVNLRAAACPLLANQPGRAARRR